MEEVFDSTRDGRVAGLLGSRVCGHASWCARCLCRFCIRCFSALECGHQLVQKHHHAHFAGHTLIWHEAAIPLAPTGGYTIVQEALESAVTPVFKEYKLDSRWHRSAYEQTEFPLKAPEP